MVVVGQEAIGLDTSEKASVISFDLGDIKAIGVETIADVASFTPNLEIRTAGSTNATFFIRGVGLNDFTANASGSVAIYQDDIAYGLPAIQLGSIFDVENVSIERGPQGSGAGRNASAGAIYVYSRKPSGNPNAHVRVDYGTFDLVDVEGALEMPVVADVLSFRGAFRLTRRDGIMQNRCGEISADRIAATGGVNLCGNFQPIASGLDDELNDTNTWAARGIVRLEAGGLLGSWLAGVNLSGVDQLGTVGQSLGTQGGYLGSGDGLGYRAPEVSREAERIAAQGPQPPTIPECNRAPDRADCLALRREILEGRNSTLANSLSKRPLDREPFVGDYNEPGFERLASYGGYLRGEWELGSIQATSITGYQHYDRERLVDADYSPNRLLEFDIEDDGWQFTQDFRVAGELSALPIAWGTGVYYAQDQIQYEQITLAGGNIRVLNQQFDQTRWAFGVWGEFEWEVIDDFTLEGGVRYNWERQSFEVEVIRSLDDSCSPRPSGLVPSCEDESTFSDPTGTLGVRYDLSDDHSVYWKFSRGWKGAQYNARDGNPPTRVIDLATPETIDAFEFGFQGAWLDGRLTLDGAVFWYMYQDYQVFQFTNDVESPPQRIVQNANDARIYGAELEARAEVLPSLMLVARLGWLESKFLDFTDTGTRVVTSGAPGDTYYFEQVIDYNGNRLPNTPRFKISGSAEYTIELGALGKLVPRYDFSWTDDVFFDASEGRGAPGVTGEYFLPRYTIGQKAYFIHNIRLSYSARDGELEVSGWVRNLSNEVYKSLAYDASTAAGLVGNFLGDPRTYGVSVELSF